MPWFLYIAQAQQTGYYYVGITTDPKRRLIEHNKGRGARMAMSQGPFTLVYISQSLLNQSVARKKEIEIKGWTRKKKEQLIQGELVLES